MRFVLKMASFLIVAQYFFGQYADGLSPARSVNYWAQKVSEGGIISYTNTLIKVEFAKVGTLSIGLKSE